MNVTYAGQIYDCTRAIRWNDRATLYLSDGGSAEFYGIRDEAWNKFQMESGDWEDAAETPSETERLSALESAVLSMMWV